MALLDEERKRLNAYASAAGLTPLGGAPALTPVAKPPTLPRPSTGAPAATGAPLGTQLGQAARATAERALDAGRTAANTGLGAVEKAFNTLTAPVRTGAGVARDAARAFAGLPAAPEAGKPLPGLSLPRVGELALPTLPTASSTPKAATPTTPAPTPRTVAPAPARTVPPPASAVPSASPAATAAGGGSAPAGRVLGTFTGRNGTRVITEADAQALAAKLPTAGGPVIAGPNGSYAAAAPGAMRTAGMVDAATRLPMPAGAPATALIRAGGDPIDAAIAQLGPIDRPSKRAALADLLRQRVTQETAQLDAATRINTTQMTEAGADRRTQWQQSGETERANLAQRGETFRTLHRPQYLPDSGGIVNTISNGVARPVLGPDGKPLRTVTAEQQRAAEQAAEARQRALEGIAKTAEGFLPVGTRPSPQDIVEARQTAAMLMGFRDFAVGPNGEKAVLINGELVPL